MNINRILPKGICLVTAAASIVLGAASCQKTYKMVAPPSVSEQDESLDDEDFWGDKSKKIFVTPYGDGEMDGSSWEDAADADFLVSALSDNTDLSSSEIYVAEGTYYMSGGSVFGPTVNKNIRSVKGGYSITSSGTDLTQRDTKAHPTVFSGDLDKDGRAGDGDCGLLSIYGGHSSFDGITFRYGHISEKTASAKKSGAGIYVDGGADTWAEFISCKFEGCTSDATTTSYAGGAAVYVVSGQARLRDCELSGCSGKSRGGAIRCNDDRAVVFLDRCSVHGNSVASEWGTGLQLSSGTACVNNSTLCSNSCGNKASGGEFNGGGAMLILNSAIISDDNTAGVRCESGTDKGSFIANSICLNLNGAPGFLLNGSNKLAVSGGHNIFSSISGDLQKAASDVICSSGLAALGSLDGNGVYVWDDTKVTVGVYATAAEIEGYAKQFSPAVCAGIGEVFAQWCGGFDVDQRGSARNPEKMLPGAYDPHLEGSSPAAVRFSLSVAPRSGEGLASAAPDALGFILTNPSGGYSYNKKIVRDGDGYKTSDGEIMLWDGKGTPVSVAAYAPYSEAADGVISISCPASQSTAENLDAADFLLCKETVDPTKDLVDGRIPLTLKHINTRITVKLTADGAEADRSKVTAVSVAGLKTSGECRIGDDSPAVTATGTATSVTTFSGDSGYELITVPQEVGAGLFSVRITYDKRQYVWTSDSEVSLGSGKTAEVAVNLAVTK